MALAAYNKSIEVSNDGGVTWHALPAESGSFELGGEVLDDTDLASNAGYRNRIRGLNDWSVSVECQWETTGNPNTALDWIIDAWQNRNTSFEVRYLYDGTNGWKGDAVVENCSFNGSVDGKEMFSAQIQANGALTDVGTP